MLTQLSPKFNIHLEHNSPFWRNDIEVLLGLFNEEKVLIICRSPSDGAWPSFDFVLDVTNRLNAEIASPGDRFYIEEDDYKILDQENLLFYVGGMPFVKTNDNELFEIVSSKIKLK